MTKVSQIVLLLTLVAATSQRNPSSSVQTVQLNDIELQRLVQHLKTHAFSKPEENPKAVRAHEHHPLLKVQTLNMFLKSKSQRDKSQREVDQGEDRICRKGMCGCGGHRCDDGDRESDKDDEVQQILDELEKELDRDASKCPEGYPCSREEIERDNDEDGTLRCGCGSPLPRFANRDEKENYEREQLRCGCGRKPGRNGDLQSQLEKLGKKYKLNDDLDAIVIDVSNLGGPLGKLVERFNDGQGNDRKPSIDVNLDFALGNSKIRKPEVSDSNEVEAFVVNLDKGNDDGGDLISRIVKDLLSKTKKSDDDPIRPNDLADFYLSKKQRLVESALNFVKNSRGNRDIGYLSGKQKYQLEQLRSHVQRVGAEVNDKEVEKEVLDIVLGEGTKSEVLPHNENNNNVYVPRWVHEAVKTSRDDLRSKRLLPLTNKQKIRLIKNKRVWRRNMEKNLNDFGVPFQLQIQGLGQVNP